MISKLYNVEILPLLLYTIAFYTFFEKMDQIRINGIYFGRRKDA